MTELTYNEEMGQYEIDTPTVTFVIFEDDIEDISIENITDKVKMLEQNFKDNKEKIYQLILEGLDYRYEELNKDNIEEKLGKPYYNLSIEELYFNTIMSDGHYIFLYVCGTFDEIEQVGLCG